MAAYERVLVEIAGGIGPLTLNRPEKLNAFDTDACSDLIEALRMLAGSDPVRVIVLTGAGRAFLRRRGPFGARHRRTRTWSPPGRTSRCSFARRRNPCSPPSTVRRRWGREPRARLRLPPRLGPGVHRPGVPQARPQSRLGRELLLATCRGDLEGAGADLERRMVPAAEAVQLVCSIGSSPTRI